MRDQFQHQDIRLQRIRSDVLSEDLPVARLGGETGGPLARQFEGIKERLTAVRHELPEPHQRHAENEK